jgi:hypothetical protein
LLSGFDPQYNAEVVPIWPGERRRARYEVRPKETLRSGECGAGRRQRMNRCSWELERAGRPAAETLSEVWVAVYPGLKPFALAKLALQQTSPGRSFGSDGGSAMREPHVSHVSSTCFTRFPSPLEARVMPSGRAAGSDRRLIAREIVEPVAPAM